MDRSELVARLREKFELALGADLLRLMDEKEVCDVMMTANGHVFVERAGRPIEDTLLRRTAAERTALVRTVVELAGGAFTREDWPIVELRVPLTGWRFTGILEPVVESPIVSIRMPARIVYPLESYVESGQMSLPIYEALTKAVRDRVNVLVVGGTGSGKTTLVNAVLGSLATQCPSDRPVILEDTPELVCSSASADSLRTWQEVSMEVLLRTALRLRPDRLVVGEVRGREARILLDAWNTAHDGGVCTLHASSARLGLRRLEQMCRGEGSEESNRSDIAEAVGAVVFVARRSVRDDEGRALSVRRIEEFLWVHGLSSNGDYQCSSAT